MSECKVFSFSIPTDERDKLAVVLKLKQHCKATGQNFSHLCVEALTKYSEAQNVKTK